MAAHVNNLKKIVDDLTLNIANINFNVDSNKTLTQQRAIDRASVIKAGSINYNCHISFIEGA